MWIPNSKSKDWVGKMKQAKHAYFCKKHGNVILLANDIEFEYFLIEGDVYCQKFCIRNLYNFGPSLPALMEVKKEMSLLLQCVAVGKALSHGKSTELDLLEQTIFSILVEEKRKLQLVALAAFFHIHYLYELFI